MTKIFVESEFAPLKKVVLAQSQFAFPDEKNEDNADLSFLTAENIEWSSGHAAEDFADAHPEKQMRWEQEKVDMQQLLESYGVEVLRPRLLTDEEKSLGRESGDGYSNFFSRDPFFAIGECVIEGNLRLPHRRYEVLPIREILIEATKEQGLYFAAPQPDISLGIHSHQGPFIEGGDVLVYHKTIFVGYSGLASNLLGIQWLQRFMRHFGYEVVPVRLHPNILHLDCALSLVREGLMIICEDAFLDGVPSQLQHWQKIPISLADASILMANGLPINEEVYITDYSFKEVITALKKHHVKVETLDYYVSRVFGGSFRCTTQPFIRE
ncbi:amidinotransferase [Enterococcus saccharolyticus]|uniref:Amidinotransferase n=1 Tax=Candidatus Enterococcus willemsii TaxID=1857215 RepID=A0ABQ6YYQ8_9ENTE|nr:MULTISPECIES: arginine deiminase family protein [Enterococcus]KAF1303302.1 amidinotransferase [Enterococcus sp. CU12B]MCD5001730.1 amidinotransferase [Enterococcus saccharolyticus]